MTAGDQQGISHTKNPTVNPRGVAHCEGLSPREKIEHEFRLVGNGSAPHLAAVLFQAWRREMVHVPYRAARRHCSVLR